MGVPLVTLESLSKTHLVPGWRTGWMRFTHAEKMSDLIQAIYRLAGGRLCAPTPTQYAVRPALEGDREFQQNFIRELKRRRDFAFERVQNTEGLSCEVPKAAFYVMIKTDNLGARDDERFVLDLLAETGVLVVHGSGFGADPRAGYFRLVYLADEATLGLVFSRLGHFLGLDQAPLSHRNDVFRYGSTSGLLGSE
jgi:aspartate/methionine/tyrosine aminotransferase